MSEKLVLDAGVLSLHFADHRGVKRYFDDIIAGRSKGLVSTFNLAEFYYKTCQKLGKQTADTWYFQTRNSGLSIVHGEELVRLAGLEKCRRSNRLALADCFALALAKSENALLLTTDSELANVGNVEVRHIRL